MKPKILFVDDEPNVLDSLRLSLRPMRVKWDMSFALGGREALDLLARTPHEVVVSDMRMPGIDGAQLLHEVQERHPESVRIILSGYSDEQSVLKTVKLAHQYLSKPCRPVDLIQAVEKALSLRDMFDSARIKAVVARLGTLPALPDTYARLVMALQDENSTLKELGDIVSKDVAMTATILRLVNSAFFGLPTRISSIHHAVNLLGGQTLRVLVLSTHLFTSLKAEDMPDFSVRLLWEHSFRVACFARTIAEKEGASQDTRDDSFIAGMLHDMGKLLLAVNLRDEYNAVLDAVRAENRPLHEVEPRLLGVTHAEVGAYLMGLWGFNNPSMAAVCWHHLPEKQAIETFTPALAVYVANCLDHDIVRINEGYARRPLCLPGDECAGFTDRLASWRCLCARYLDEHACDD